MGSKEKEKVIGMVNIEKEIPDEDTVVDIQEENEVSESVKKDTKAQTPPPRPSKKIYIIPFFTSGNYGTTIGNQTLYFVKGEKTLVDRHIAEVLIEKKRAKIAE